MYEIMHIENPEGVERWVTYNIDYLSKKYVKLISVLIYLPSGKHLYFNGRSKKRSGRRCNI